MDTKIVLIGAGSAAFGPPTFNDLNQSKILAGSTITLHDIDKEKLQMVCEVVSEDNRKIGDKFNIECTSNREIALQGADFIINATEHGDRFELRWQDNTIPRKHGTTERMAENGGPGGFFHSARQIPDILKIAKDVERICPDAFFINYSNPVSRICLALKRALPKLKVVGLCHQIALLTTYHLPTMMNRELKDMQLITGGLNHFAFLFRLKDLKSNADLMPEFNSKCLEYFTPKKHRFMFGDLTLELYKKFRWFAYVGDNHICEYLQIGSQYTTEQDLTDWITMMEQQKINTNKRLKKFYNLLKEGSYPEKGLVSRGQSGERAIPIIEAILQDSNSYEIAVNILNEGIIENLPQDLVIECSGTVNKEGIHGVKLGHIPKNIAALLRIEASIQDLCVEAILQESKQLAIDCLAVDVNCGSFEMAEAVYNEMMEVQKQYLPNFK
ncbi:MAG: family 4 glycosyl hydrolase [Promethearchaeota archaeon]|jgi:alpha-galactosidase